MNANAVPVAAARSRRLLARGRQVGVRRTVQVAVQRAGQRANGTSRGLRLRLRPLTVGPGELRVALGDMPLERALRDLAGPALPSVQRFERSLTSLDDAQRASLIARADAVLAHRFDLLGSGPTDLGARIDWSRDFRAGRSWPRKHIYLLRTFYSDDSDVKLPWELSRFQHLPLLAAAHRVTGDRAYLDEIGAQLEDWIESNPVEMGPNWLCTMDVAIRAANWIATLEMVAAEVGETSWGDRVASSLLLHGRFIRSHLENTQAHRTNHYLSNVVGLLLVATLFSRSREGAAWADWATEALIEEMSHQVLPDGCGNEASIPYHRLVCELFVCGTQAADALGGRQIPAWYRERLERMLEFVRDYTRPDSLAPQIGDNDDGRFLPLDDYGHGDLRSHLHLFGQADREYRAAAESARYPEGGYYVMREAGLYVLVRCGQTGMQGVGGHAHNDQLAIELCYEDQPMVVDPGTYDYYTDQEMRLQLRSTRSHATLQIDGAEQNELPLWPRFPLGDRTNAQATEWRVEAGSTVFAGRHHGYAALAAPAIHERRVELRKGERTVIVEDRVTSDASHLLEWAFPLAGGEVAIEGSRVTADFGGRRLTIDAAGVDFRVEPGWYSPSFGVRARVPVIRGSKRSRPGVETTELRLAAE